MDYSDRQDRFTVKFLQRDGDIQGRSIMPRHLNLDAVPSGVFASGYFDNIKIDGPTTSGHVLTADIDGWGTWEEPTSTFLNGNLIKDANGNELLDFSATASAVNYFKMVNSATGDGVDLQALGDDTNIDLLLTPKGIGNVGIGTTTPNNTIQVEGLINFNDTTYSTSLGSGAGASLASTGDLYNTAVGYQALNKTTTGHFNSAIGYRALYSNTTGYSNSAIGYRALRSNTTGSDNSATGYEALFYNTTGNSNSATGYAALYYNTTGYYNSATGARALFCNTTGWCNSAIGYRALRSNTTGDNNSATGYEALFYNTTGNSNSATGMYALYFNTTGYYNSATGYQALYSNTTGDNNSAIGYAAGYYIAGGTSANATGTDSLFLGADTKALADGQTNQTVIGYGATGIGSNSIVLGNDSVVTTVLKGDVGIGDTSPSVKLAVSGDVAITGALSKGSGSFLIDHPLDPTNKLLRYGFTESPRYELIHRGTAKLTNGKATVNIDTEYGMTAGTFQALTQNVQVTNVQAVNSFIRVKATKVTGAEFTIEAEDNTFAGEVNWLVIAERNDAFAKSIDHTDKDGHLINEIEKEEPTAEELKKLEDRIEYVEKQEDVGETTEEVRMKGKGYYRHTEAHNATLPARKVIRKLKKEKEVK